MKLLQLNPLPGILAFSLLLSSLHAFEPQIKLTGRKDLVLSSESRQLVLKIGLAYLANEKGDYLARLEELSDPFSFKDATPVAPVVAKNTVPEEAPEPVTINYDDAAVLEASSASFSQQVRGSISRGDSRFLQLEGGVLLKPGTSFPVRLPQAKGQTFTLTITEITSSGYTLQMGEATKQLNFDQKSQSNSGSIKFTNP